jgi:hypothetical protein
LKEEEEEEEATRYYFLSVCCCLKFAVLYYGAPSLTRGVTEDILHTPNERRRRGGGRRIRRSDQILLPVGMLLSEICGRVSLGRPL